MQQTEFVSEIALQNSVPDDAINPQAKEDRVSVSSIHRSKGLEWCDVYSPFLNEKLMPAKFRDEKGNKAERHVSGCAQRRGMSCDKKCSEFYQQGDAHARGTPEERHDNEERRLAHVAATRAKDRLIFLSVQPVGSAAGGMGLGRGKGLGGGRGVGGRGAPPWGNRPDWEPSSFEQQLTKLPENVFLSKVCS